MMADIPSKLKKMEIVDSEKKKIQGNKNNLDNTCSKNERTTKRKKTERENKILYHLGT